MLFVSFASIYWGWWLGFFENPAVDAFLMTALFQIARNKTSSTQYALLWKVLLGFSVIWGGWALIEYLFNFLKWNDQRYFLPTVAIGIAIAKSKERLRIAPYLTLLAFVFLIWQYGSSALDLVRMYLGIGEIAGSEVGNGAGYGLATIGLSSSFDWFVFKMPGLVLLACVLVVPPKKERVPETAAND